jgi:uridine phosphorylase
MNNTYHLAIDQNLVSNTQWLITCGEPLRTDKIASYLDDPEMIGNNREYRICCEILEQVGCGEYGNGMFIAFYNGKAF